MAFDPITAVADLGGKILDRVVPDPTAKAQAQLALQQLTQSGQLAQLTAETDLLKGQMATNTAEATNASLFVAGWRPFIGWVCGAGLGEQFLLRPFALFAANIFHVHGITAESWPTLDLGTVVTLLFGMLGLGTMRTVEKINGINAGH